MRNILAEFIICFCAASTQPVQNWGFIVPGLQNRSSADWIGC